MSDGVLHTYTYNAIQREPAKEASPRASKHCQGKERQACLTKSLHNNPLFGRLWCQTGLELLSLDVTVGR